MTAEADEQGLASTREWSRRELIRRAPGGALGTLAAAGGGVMSPPQIGPRPADEPHGRVSVVITSESAGPALGAGYAGFSYEKAALSGGLFSSRNKPLVALFRRLGPGLLRLGGNTVDRTGWTMRPAAAGMDAVTSGDVDALSTFLAATGWRALYGLNLATGTPARAAAEASYAARTLGAGLYAFEIGNEPDAYAYNQLRPQTYTYADFLGEWNSFARAVRQAVPPARLTGPASAWHETSWTVPFARDEGRGIVLLTQHYYRANGLSPKSTLALLLAGDPALPGLLDPLREASRAAGIADGYRLTEANSFYDGGAPHVSDTFGTALWAIDFLFANLKLGSSGVNFHGGGDSPGYTPIADDGRAVVGVRAEYYGLLLFSLILPGRLLSLRQSGSPLAISAYAVATRAGLDVVLVNKEGQAGADVTVTFDAPVETARLFRLSASALDSRHGITLNGAPIGPDGGWSPRPPEILPARAGSITLGLPPASSFLVRLT